MEAVTIHIGTIGTGGKAGIAVHVIRDARGVGVLVTTNDGVGKNNETVRLDAKTFGELLGLLTKAQQRASSMLSFGS